MSPPHCNRKPTSLWEWGWRKSFPNDPSFQVGCDEIQQNPIPLMIILQEIGPQHQQIFLYSLFYQQNCGVEPAESARLERPLRSR